MLGRSEDDGARFPHSFCSRQDGSWALLPDTEARDLYDLEVPVVSIDGRVRFRGMVNAVLLRRELRSAANP